MIFRKLLVLPVTNFFQQDKLYTEVYEYIRPSTIYMQIT